LPQASDDLAAVLAADPTVFTAQSVHEIALNYVGGEVMLEDPYAFAANGDVSGQPPHLILNSETDSLRASGEAYAAAT
jgi:acetyl esterase/lipase